ncbi:hypothetical protein PGT21_001803 [Puccinia graminis f. sp. tritici]|nr:hypothetical protein PGT21_001803 [Puccinia graminis f. sp. tritici]
MTLRSSRKLVRPSEVELVEFTFTQEIHSTGLVTTKKTAVAKYFEELAHAYLKLGISGRHGSPKTLNSMGTRTGLGCNEITQAVPATMKSP